ncbi:MAG TPA: polysaccharide deacetylase, partial [Burkholderiaceae bacterium]
MRLRLHVLVPAAAAVACLALAGCHRKPATETSPVPAAASGPRPAASAVVAELKDVLAAHRQIIVLFADEKRQTDVQRAAADEVGQAIFHDNRAHVARIESQFETLAAGGEDPTPALAPILDFIESDPSLFDADRL